MDNPYEAELASRQRDLLDLHAKQVQARCMHRCCSTCQADWPCLPTA